ncbi:MAG: hypothetical protein LC808_21540 [Actinobacteria bacterium]|nr:hypothetical protein [Actinomycetota bacterium]
MVQATVEAPKRRLAVLTGPVFPYSLIPDSPAVLAARYRLALLGFHGTGQPWVAGTHQWGPAALCHRSHTVRYWSSATPYSLYASW